VRNLQDPAKANEKNMTNEARRERIGRDNRVQTEFESLYTSDRQEGAGTLSNISYSGAQIAGASLKPELGTKVGIYVFIQPVSPFELIGEVVRHTEDGFAIALDPSTQEIRNLVDDASAIVNVRSKRD
jgi:hypothetical protein